MPWIQSYVTYVPEWCITAVARVSSLRASPRLLIGVCCLQFAVLGMGLLQQLSRVECGITVPTGGPVVIECDSCRHRSLTLRSGVLHLGGAGVIACGIFAVKFRSARLLYVYGTAMLLFSLVVGLTAMLTALEAPVLEVAVSGVSDFDTSCMELAEEMLASARDHTTLAGLGCIVDTVGAVLAIRSKELFNCARRGRQHRSQHAPRHARRLLTCPQISRLGSSRGQMRRSHRSMQR